MAGSKKFYNNVLKVFSALVLTLAIMLNSVGISKLYVVKADYVTTWGAISTVFDATPGEKLHIEVEVKMTDLNYSTNQGSVSAIVKPGDGAPFRSTTATLSKGSITDKNAIAITSYDPTKISADIDIFENAKIGQYPAEIAISFTGYDSMSDQMITSASIPITINVSQEKAAAQLSVSDVKYDTSKAVVGGAFDLSFNVKNDGEIKALNVYQSVEYGDTGMAPNYSTENIKVGDIAGGSSKSQTVSIKVLPTAEVGYKTLTLKFTYKDSTGNTYEVSRNVYITIAKQAEAKTGDARLIAYSDSLNDSVTVNSKYKLSLTIENLGEKKAKDVKVSLPDEGGIGVSSGILADFSGSSLNVNDIAAGDVANISIPLYITTAASSGLKEIAVNVTYKSADSNTAVTATTKAYITVLETKQSEIKNDVRITDVTQLPDLPRPGEKVTLTFNVTNNGSGKISNLTLKGLDLSSSTFEPVNADGSVAVGAIEKGASKKVSMTFKVGSAAAEGMGTLKLALNYKDEKGNAQTEEASMYVLNIQKSAAEATPTPEPVLINNISISNISQSPSNPEAGSEVTVSFKITNKGTDTAKNLEIGGTDLSTSTFEPVSSEAMKQLGSLEAGESRDVVMTFKVGKDAPEGFGQLRLGYTYYDKTGAQQSGTTAINIIGITNSGSKNSKPRLIISEYSTDSEALVAGSEFNLSFTIRNTHATKAAKNITVGVSQAEGIFTTTTGSDTIYIAEIRPGEEFTATLPMKTKNDAATGLYEIKIHDEYEYDDMSQVDAEAGGVKEDNTIKLNAIENARPVVQNINIGAGMDTPTEGTSIAMAFDFYNMGKSTLNNVYATVSGDFSLDSSEMFYIGSVTAGNSVIDNEPSVIPAFAGTCSGVLTIHYEDSNGNEKTVDFDIPATEVMPAADFGGMDFGGGDFGGMDGYMPDVEPAKEIVPKWAFITGEIVLFIAAALITRAIMIKRKKAELIRKDEEENA